MNRKQTWWLFGAAAALLGFILFVERSLPGSGESPRVERHLAPGLDTNAVTSLEIRLPDQPTIRLRRETGGWELTEPLNYPAESVIASLWLGQFADARWQVRLTPEDLRAENRSAADFGLQQPRATVVLGHGEESTEVRFGDRAQVGNQMYLQLSDQGGVFIVDGALLDRLPLEVDTWRDRSVILNFGELNFNRIEARHQSRGYTLATEIQPDGGIRWRLTHPIDARAAPESAVQLLRQLAFWRVEEFVREDPGADLESYGLASPESVLAIGRGTNDLLTIEIGKTHEERPDLVYARLRQHGNVVLTGRQTADMLRLPYGHWRDSRVVRLEPEKIRSIVAGGVSNYRLEKREAGWEITEPETMPADQEWVDGFLRHLNAMEIVKFEKDIVTDFTPYGLAAPARQYTLWTTTNAAAETNEFEIPRLSFGANPEDEAFVRRSDESAVYGIARENFTQLPVAHWQWRERQIWNFTTNQVRRVTVSQAGKTREIARQEGAGTWTLAPGSQGVLEPDVEEAVFRLGKLRANWWAARGAASRETFGFTDQSLKITFEMVVDGRKQSRTLEIGGFRDGYSPYGGVRLDDGEFWIFDFPLGLFYDHVNRVFALEPPAGLTR